MIYIKEKEDGIIVPYEVKLDNEKLGMVLTIIDAYVSSNDNENNVVHGNLCYLRGILIGTLNNDEESLYRFFNSDLFTDRYDFLLKKVKEEYELFEVMVKRNTYPEVRKELVEQYIALGEQIVKLEQEKYYNDTVYRFLLKEALSAISFEVTTVTNEQVVEYKEKIRKKVK